MRKEFWFLITVLILSSCGSDGPFDRGGCIQGSGNIVTQVLPVSSFTNLISVGSFDVTIRHADEQSITAIGQANIISFLNQEVSGDDYFLGFEEGCYNNFTLSVIVETPLLSSVVASGSGDVFIESLTATENFRASTSGSGQLIGGEQLQIDEKLNLDLTGSGNIDLDISSLVLEVRQSGSGNVQLTGSVDDQLVIKSGSGNYLAGSLQSRVCEITSTGSGIAEVNVSEELTVQLTGSGSVFYEGSPSVSSTSLGSGVVQPK